MVDVDVVVDVAKVDGATYELVGVADADEEEEEEEVVLELEALPGQTPPLSKNV